MRLTREQYSYLMGFVCTDGSLGYNRGKPEYVGFYSTDKGFLDTLFRALDVPGREIFVARKAIEKYKAVWGFTLRGQWVGYFMSLGLTRKDEASLENMSVDLYHFLRGYLDGDGSIILKKSKALDKLRFLGRPLMIASIKEGLEREGFEVKSYPAKSRVKVLRVVDVGGKQAHAILDRMYEGASLFMRRKKDLYLSMRRKSNMRRSSKGNGWIDVSP